MLRLKNVCKTINDETVLNNVNISINQGDYVCVTGSPRKARESLIRLFCGITMPTEGELYIDGVEVREYDFDSLAKLRREKIACMLLDMDLDENLSVVDNVRLPLVYAGRDKKKKEELTSYALNILGMQKLATQKVKNLTDWQKNKVSLARAIVTSPRVLIIEEPCRNFDPAKIIEVEGLLSALANEGITVIISSSQSYFEEKANIVYLIKDSEVVETKRVRLIKKDSSPTIKKPRKKKAKKENLEELVEPGDTQIEIKKETAEIFEKEKQMTFDIFDVNTEDKAEPEKKPRKSRKGIKKGDESNEN